MSVLVTPKKQGFDVAIRLKDVLDGLAKTPPKIPSNSCFQGRSVRAAGLLTRFAR